MNADLSPIMDALYHGRTDEALRLVDAAPPDSLTVHEAAAVGLLPRLAQLPREGAARHAGVRDELRADERHRLGRDGAPAVGEDRLHASQRTRGAYRTQLRRAGTTPTAPLPPAHGAPHGRHVRRRGIAGHHQPL